MRHEPFSTRIGSSFWVRAVDRSLLRRAPECSGAPASVCERLTEQGARAGGQNSETEPFCLASRSSIEPLKAADISPPDAEFELLDDFAAPRALAGMRAAERHFYCVPHHEVRCLPAAAAHLAPTPAGSRRSLGHYSPSHSPEEFCDGVDEAAVRVEDGLGLSGTQQAPRHPPELLARLQELLMCAAFLGQTCWRRDRVSELAKLIDNLDGVALCQERREANVDLSPTREGKSVFVDEPLRTLSAAGPLRGTETPRHGRLVGEVQSTRRPLDFGRAGERRCPSV
jgi:hypothetical protein